MEEIVNRVANSGLIAVDLLDYLPKSSDLVAFDFAPFLWEGLVLREKEFRTQVAEHNWKQYEGKIVYLFCSSDAILPSWSFLLVTSQLIGIAELTVVGTEKDALQRGLEQRIRLLNLADFEGGKLIVKGCSDLPDSNAAMLTFLQHIQPVAQSIMFGEPCSTVPIFKRKKEK